MTKTQPITVDDVLRSEYQKSVANYWNTNKNDPVNLLLGHIDGYYHHHYGIGDVDWSVLDGPESLFEKGGGQASRSGRLGV